MQRIITHYSRWILSRPILVILFFVALTSVAAVYLPQFRLDASSETLLLENDQSLKYYRSIKARYGSDDFLVLTYQPQQALFSRETLDKLEVMAEELAAVNGISQVISILDAPLLHSPRVNIQELQGNIRTLKDADVDLAQAKQELTNSPLFSDLVVSRDGQITTMMLTLKREDSFVSLQKERGQLKQALFERGKLSGELQARLTEINTAYAEAKSTIQLRDKATVAQVRAVVAEHQNEAEMFLGGVPMITADSMEYVKSDIRTFGVGVLLFIVLILAVAFKRLQWVILPIITCAGTCVIMVGLLGFLNWPVTVVSSNFISLMLIITLSLTIHLIVRYQEFHAANPDAPQREIVLDMVKGKTVPCIFTATTTMVAFMSLVVSDIRPIMDFGWMMTIGVFVALFCALTLFPALLMLFKPGAPVNLNNVTEKVTSGFAWAIEKKTKLLVITFSVGLIVSLTGISQLTVENRFIDYFKKSTEIYQGMELIDKHFGGTTPLDIVLTPPASFFVKPEVQEQQFDDDMLAELGLSADDLADLEEENDTQGGIASTSYWFNAEGLLKVKAIHDYVDALPESGKVLSIATTRELIAGLEPRMVEDNFQLSILYNKLPEEIRKVLVAPYMTDDGNEVRISVRMFESFPDLQRGELLQRIQNDLENKLALKPEQIGLTGMLILYNNMLQSLFDSQILTIGVVFMAIMLMFVLLFRNALLAFIAVVPNMAAAGIILGFMGWTGIPLDLMTITIAAICIGIAVDNSIHYVCRFNDEFAKVKDYRQAIRNSHVNVGRAMYYTSAAIAIGFSILALSNFIPTVYFGLLTSLAMIIALVANLTMLPIFLIWLKPHGKVAK